MAAESRVDENVEVSGTANRSPDGGRNGQDARFRHPDPQESTGTLKGSESRRMRRGTGLPWPVWPAVSRETTIVRQSSNRCRVNCSSIRRLFSRSRSSATRGCWCAWIVAQDIPARTHCRIMRLLPPFRSRIAPARQADPGLFLNRSGSTFNSSISLFCGTGCRRATINLGPRSIRRPSSPRLHEPPCDPGRSCARSRRCL